MDLLRDARVSEGDGRLNFARGCNGAASLVLVWIALLLSHATLLGTAADARAAHLERPRPPTSRRQVRWFASNLPETLAMVRAHPRSLSGLYPGFSAAGMHDNGSFAGQHNNGTRQDRQAALPCDNDGNLLAPYPWSATFLPLGLTVEPVVDVSAVALCNGTAHRAIAAMVQCAIHTNITGYMVDFESFGAVRPPAFRGGAADLATIYTDWLRQLGRALHAAGKTLAVCVSDYGILGQYGAGYGASEIDTVMTMATYYNMANSSSHASIGPLRSWKDVRQLWAQWLLVPMLGPSRPPAASTPSCTSALRDASCVEGAGDACELCLEKNYHQLMAANCSRWPCLGPHSSACFTSFEDQYCAPGTLISRSQLSAGIGQMTTVGCGCQNGSKGCCDHITSPLTDKAFAAQPSNFPPPCHSLGSTGNCFFWTQNSLQRFVDWCAARINNVDVYRADFNANGAFERVTTQYYFDILEGFLATPPLPPTSQ
eukprot:SAG31_NODE_4965_length_2830_cov_2.789821_3_plen_485_part_00